MTGYDVLADDLRSASGEYHAVGDKIADYKLGAANIDPQHIGHVELAAWIKAVTEKCDEAGSALHDGVDLLATAVMDAAGVYERMDDDVATGFTNLLLPYGNGTSPFLPGTPGSFGTAPTPLTTLLGPLPTTGPTTGPVAPDGGAQ